MDSKKPSSQFATHEVTNQPPPLEDYDAYATDPALQEAVEREGGGWGADRLQAYGKAAGGELLRLGFQANENPPKLRTFDRYGHRIDEVEFHPSYHRIMEVAKAHELPSLPWTDPGPGAQVVRSGMNYLHSQMELGTGCPLTMTYAAIPALRSQPDVAQWWEPRILANEYDPRCIPADQKKSLTIGMGMTEKQGGSDVRSNSTRAVAIGAGGPGADYELVGHKWFFSAPMCDAHLVLAYAEGGQSCFLVPKWRPDGSRNEIHIQRLKDKLGDKSNASSEVEFHGAYGVMIGEEGRGVRTIIDMVMHTRLDCMTGSSGIMRQALVQAIHHCRHRKAFGKRLIEQPLMQNVLADLAVESEASMALALRVSRAIDAAPTDDQEKAYARLVTAVGKYWICKRTPAMVNEAQECLGGNGYVEEFILPRLYRQAPLNSIWEGSGNVQCLDVLRAMSRSPASVDAFFAELESARGAHKELDGLIDQLHDEFDKPQELQARSRSVVERMALALQGALLSNNHDDAVFQAFCAGRISHRRGLAFGTLPAGTPMADIIERAFPA